MELKPTEVSKAQVNIERAKPAMKIVKPDPLVGQHYTHSVQNLEDNFMLNFLNPGMKYYVLSPFLNYLTPEHKLYRDNIILQKRTKAERMLAATKAERPVIRNLTPFEFVLSDSSILKQLSSIKKVKDRVSSVIANLYLVDSENQCIIYLPDYLDGIDRQPRIPFYVDGGFYLNTYVAATGIPVHTEDIYTDERFTKGISHRGLVTQSAMCVPITCADTVISVFFLTRDYFTDQFTKEEFHGLQILSKYLGNAIHAQYISYRTMVVNQLQIYLFKLLACYVNNPVITLEVVLFEVMDFVRQILNVSKVFFHRLKKNLLGTMFLETWGEDLPGRCVTREFDGIAHTPLFQVITSNKPMVNHDVSSNQAVPYYQMNVHNFLSVPVSKGDYVNGVIDVVNKSNSNFTNNDLMVLTEASYFIDALCGYGRLANTLSNLEPRIEVAIEMLKHHSLVCIHDVKELSNLKIPVPFNLFDISFSTAGFSSMQLSYLARIIFERVLGPAFVDPYNITRLILFIRKAHREAKHHDFFQDSFRSFQLLAYIFENEAYSFSLEDKESMLLAALMHLVNWKGFVSYKRVTCYEKSATSYFASIIARHCQVGKKQLNIDKIMKLLKAGFAFNETLNSIETLIKLMLTDTFDFTNPNHMEYVQVLLMVIAYLGDEARPIVTSSVYKEGEMKQAFTDLSNVKSELKFKTFPAMFDISKKHLLTSEQITYLQKIVLPLIHLLNCIFPCTSLLYRVANNNLDQWKLIDQGKLWTDIWQPELSYVEKNGQTPGVNAFTAFKTNSHDYFRKASTRPQPQRSSRKFTYGASKKHNKTVGFTN